MKKYILMPIMSLFVFVNVSWAAECGKSQALDREYSYCIYKSDRTKNADVLYYFHGLGFNEKRWQNSTIYKALRKKWKAEKYDFPTVVSVSFGSLWVLTEIERRGDLFNKMVDIVMPKLEEKIGGLHSGQRLLLGESMGGLNASQLYLKRPDFFSKVALLCPAISTLGPFAQNDEIIQYILRTGAEATHVGRLMIMAKNEFKTPIEWQAHNPLELIRIPLPSAPEMYVSCGDRDEYGFYEGVKQFYDSSILSFRRAVWKPIPNGRHCAVHVDSLAKFLMSEHPTTSPSTAGAQ